MQCVVLGSCVDPAFACVMTGLVESCARRFPWPLPGDAQLAAIKVADAHLEDNPVPQHILVALVVPMALLAC